MKKVKLGAVVLAAAALGAGLYWTLVREPENIMPSDQAPAQTSAPAPAAVVLSEELFLEKALGLCSHSRWGDWLKVESFISRITAAAAIVAEGKSPRDSLSFLKPGKPFSVKTQFGKLIVNPGSFARYDFIADAVGLVNAAAAAELFEQFKPLFQKAHEELGLSGDVRDTYLRAAERLLRVPVVEGDVEVKKKVLSYTLTDQRLENLTAAQKHLLRMGPKNVVKIQDKLREFSRALGGR